MILFQIGNGRSRFLIFAASALYFCFLTVSPIFAFLDSWSTTENIPSPLASHTSIAYLDKIFIFGGSAFTGYSHDEVPRSHASLGTLSSWDTLSLTTPSALIFHTTINDNTKIYVLGGKEENPGSARGTVNSVYLGVINGSGVVGAWTPQVGLPKNLEMGGAIVSGDTLYYLGGHSESPTLVSSDIYKSVIGSDGSLSSWTGAGSLPEPLTDFGITVFGGKVFVVGGYSGVINSATVNVWRGVIDSSGTIGNWTAVTPLPLALGRSQITQSGDKIVVAGGIAGTIQSKTYYSAVDASGNMNGWSLGADLPHGICCGSITAMGGYVYLSGGFNGTYLNTVYVSNVNAPTPTPQFVPVIIIPGMGGSWNYEAIVHNQTLPNASWQLNPFVKVYDNLIDTLQDEGYVLGDNLYVYNYDWRRKINDNASDFVTFVQGLGYPNVNVIGHSMGGLIARSALKLQPDLFEKIVIAGTPNTGSAISYKLWEGADFLALSPVQRLAIELYINTSGDRYRNNVSAIQNLIPSIQDVLPTYDFLKGNGDTYKPVSAMVWKNNFLPLLVNNQLQLDKTKTVVGTGFGSLKEMKYTVRSDLDRALDKWIDGKPTTNIFSDGDDAVISTSANLSGVPATTNLLSHHASLLDNELGIEGALSYFGVNADFLGSPVVLADSVLVVTVGSPATFTVKAPNGEIFLPEQGLVVINNPADGIYEINLTATGAGEYEVNVGKLTPTDSAWENYRGVFIESGQTTKITTDTESGQTNLGSLPLDEAARKLAELLPVSKNKSWAGGIKTAQMGVSILKQTQDLSKFKGYTLALIRTIYDTINAGESIGIETKYIDLLRQVIQDVEEEIENRL